MTNWLQEDTLEAEKSKKDSLPNPDAPRLMKVDELPKKKVPKKPVLIKVDENIHEQLSRIVNLEKLAGNKEATITGMFLEGIDLYLKKRKLPNLREIEKGVVITEDMIKR